MTWKSAWTTVVTVDKIGLATARAAGATAVRAISNAKPMIYGAASVTVRPTP